MKSILCLLLVIAVSTSMISYCHGAYYPDKDWQITKYRAVTRSIELVNYYKELRSKIKDPISKEPQESDDPEERALIKKNICKNIFRGAFFENRSEYWININKEVERKNLKDHYESIFKDIFISSSNHKRFWSSKYWDEYSNPYYLLPTIYADNDFSRMQEHTIVCPVRESARSNHVKEYYVSRPYNVNIVQDAYPILGRFIFSSTSTEQLSLEALAEESAISSEFFRRTKLIEPYYLAKRKYFRTPDDANLDPMCSLSDADKVRLCAICLGASVFESKGFKFIPEVDNVETECQRKLIKTSTRAFKPVFRIVGRMVFNPHKLYEELVIVCHTKSQKRSSTSFYIARGTHHNTVFVFKEAKDKQRLSLYSFLNNVSVIKEIRPTLPVDLLSYD